jgi:hypothetical protein
MASTSACVNRPQVSTIARGELALAVAGADADEARCPVAVLFSLVPSLHAENISAHSTIAPAVFMGTSFRRAMRTAGNRATADIRRAAIRGSFALMKCCL